MKRLIVASKHKISKLQHDEMYFIPKKGKQSGALYHSIVARMYETSDAISTIDESF